MNASRQNGPSIRAWRIEKGLSVQELCDIVTEGGRDLSAPALRNIELEHRNCQPDLMVRIAKALSVSTDILCRVPIAEWESDRGAHLRGGRRSGAGTKATA